jgi:hypothetical protein
VHRIDLKRIDDDEYMFGYLFLGFSSLLIIANEKLVDIDSLYFWFIPLSLFFIQTKKMNAALEIFKIMYIMLLCVTLFAYYLIPYLMSWLTMSLPISLTLTFFITLFLMFYYHDKVLQINAIPKSTLDFDDQFTKIEKKISNQFSSKLLLNSYRLWSNNFSSLVYYLLIFTVLVLLINAFLIQTKQQHLIIWTLYFIILAVAYMPLDLKQKDKNSILLSVEQFRGHISPYHAAVNIVQTTMLAVLLLLPILIDDWFFGSEYLYFPLWAVPLLILLKLNTNISQELLSINLSVTVFVIFLLSLYKVSSNLIINDTAVLFAVILIPSYQIYKYRHLWQGRLKYIIISSLPLLSYVLGLIYMTKNYFKQANIFEYYGVVLFIALLVYLVCYRSILRLANVPQEV